MELHGWPGSGNHETKKYKKYGAYVFSKALIWNVHSRSVRAGQPASCCLLFAVWFVVFWCYSKQTKQQQHKTPIVILLRWFFGALSFGTRKRRRMSVFLTRRIVDFVSFTR